MTRMTIRLAPDEARAIRSLMSARNLPAAGVVRRALAGDLVTAADLPAVSTAQGQADGARPWKLSIRVAADLSLKHVIRGLRIGLGLSPERPTQAALAVRVSIPAAAHSRLLPNGSARTAALRDLLTSIVTGADERPALLRLFGRSGGKAPKDRRVQMTVHAKPAVLEPLGPRMIAENWHGSLETFAAHLLGRAILRFAADIKAEAGMVRRSRAAPVTAGAEVAGSAARVPVPMDPGLADTVIRMLRQTSALGNNANQMARGINAIRDAIENGRVIRSDAGSSFPDHARVAELQAAIVGLGQDVGVLAERVTGLADTLHVAVPPGLRRGLNQVSKS